MSKKSAVIGLGNTLRRDDGIGIIILESLLNAYKHPEIDYLNFGTASFDLLNCLRNYQSVLLIDGIQAGLKPADLKIFSLSQAEFGKHAQAISSHELNLRDIFELSKKLEIETKIYVAGIQIENSGFGESLSGELKNKVSRLTGEIEKFIVERLLK